MISLNNREIAWLVWLGIGLMWVLAKEQPRQALWQVARAFCSYWILSSVALMLAYIAVCVVILAGLHIWQWDNLKTTLVWCVTFAFVTMMDVNRISEDDSFYRQTVRDTLSATALVLFVAEFEPFSLVAELMILPAMAFVALCVTVVRIRSDLNDVKWLVEGVASIAVLGLLIASVVTIWQEPQEFLSWNTFREFLVPTLLSFLFLPLIYLLSTYVVFERTFRRLSILWPDENLRQYGYSKAVFAFWGDLDAARRWSRDVSSVRPENREGVDQSIREVLEAKRREKSPPHVTPDAGWSPYQAKAFLECKGLKTGDYHKSYDGRWAASSRPLEIDDALLPSTVDYAVEGNKLVATRLKLKLKTFLTKQDAVGREVAGLNAFARFAERLVRAAVPDIAWDPINAAIVAGGDHSVGGVTADVRVSRSDRENENLRIFELVLYVVHHGHRDGQHDFSFKA